MDTKTGDIRYIPRGTILRENEISCDLPRKGCKKCYGRGWTGRRIEDGTVIPCSCIFRFRARREKNANA